jgi:hypothetical protein
MGLETVVPVFGTIETSRPDAAFIGNLVKGPVFLVLVKEGMTDEQVEQILGKATGWEMEGSLDPCKSYGRLGVNVQFSFVEGKVLRFYAYRFVDRQTGSDTGSR